MNDCKYYKYQKANGIIHEICVNAELKKNSSNGKNITCMGIVCGKYEKIESKKKEQNEYNK